MDLFATRPNVEQVTSMFFSVLRASVSDPDVELTSLVPNQGYREAFLNLSRNLAPTGKSFERLEIRDASVPALEPVVLEVMSRRNLNSALKKIRAPREQEASEEAVEVRGVLRGLHLDQDWLEVATGEEDPQKPTRIEQAGEVLDDVVGPMVNHRVVVTAIRRKGRLIYRDIEADE
jgi:hypothetical protein